MGIRLRLAPCRGAHRRRTHSCALQRSRSGAVAAVQGDLLRHRYQLCGAGDGTGRGHSHCRGVSAMARVAAGRRLRGDHGRSGSQRHTAWREHQWARSADDQHQQSHFDPVDPDLHGDVLDHWRPACGGADRCHAVQRGDAGNVGICLVRGGRSRWTGRPDRSDRRAVWQRAGGQDAFVLTAEQRRRGADAISGDRRFAVAVPDEFRRYRIPGAAQHGLPDRS